MVDVHSHVLYALDDGARTLEDSVGMAKLAAERGTTDLVATPHANFEYTFDPQTVAARLAEIQNAVGSAIRLHSGCDFHLSYDNIQDAVEHPRKYTIAQGNYLLVEFSDLMILHNTAEILARLVDAGMIPVITHPERNSLLRQRMEDLAKWVEQGARLQVTARSLTGLFGKRALEFSKQLLGQGLVHVVASDAHDCEYRPPRLDEAYDWLNKRYGQSLADLLCCSNPKATLTGQPMVLPEPCGAGRHWYQFWR